MYERAGNDHDKSRCKPMHPYTSTFMCRLPNHSLGQKRTKRAVMFRFRKCFVTVLVRAALVNIYGKKKALHLLQQITVGTIAVHMQHLGGTISRITGKQKAATQPPMLKC